MRGFKKLYFRSFNSINKKKKIPDLIKRSGIKIIFPFYHVVSDESLPYIENLYPVKKILDFMADIDFLLENYLPLHPNDFINGNYDTDKNYFVLSFDDGLRKMVDVVAPILKRKAVSAIFFINSAFVDSKGLFYRYKISLIIEGLKDKYKRKNAIVFLKNKKYKFISLENFLLTLNYNDILLIDQLLEIAGYNEMAFLKTTKPYLSIQEIDYLKKDNYVFGAHSIDHPLYADVDEQEQIRQTEISVQYLKNELQQPNALFAFPFSADNVSSKIFEHMYDTLSVVFSFGTSGIGNTFSSRHINRIPMEVKGYSAEEIIKNEYAYFIFKKKFGR